MPIYPDKGVLFIHVPKTAGIFISKVLGVDFGRYYDRYRPSLADSQKMLSHFCRAAGQNDASPWSSLSRKLRRLAVITGGAAASPGRSREHLIGSAQIRISLQNMTVSELLRFGYISREQLLSAKKIVSVRHPEDRFRSLVSYWNFLELGLSVDWVIENCVANPNPMIPVEVLATFSPMSFYVHCPLVGFDQWSVIRYEHLLIDLEKILRDTGTEANLPGIPRINASESGKVILNDHHLDVIREYYSSDYELFHYN